MSLRPKKGRVAVSILEVYTHICTDNLENLPGQVSLERVFTRMDEHYIFFSLNLAHMRSVFRKQQGTICLNWRSRF